MGAFRFTELLADYRRYDPIIFNFLTVASRVLVSASFGRDADSLRKYIGYPEIIRGYDRESFPRRNCQIADPASIYRCQPLQGSRVAIANLELRFPLLRGGALGVLPLPLPPIEGLLFYDAGVAWFGGQDVSLSRTQPDDYDPTVQRHLLTSYGFGVRVNLFNFAILRWDYAIPKDRPGRDGFWRFSLGPSF